MTAYFALSLLDWQYKCVRACGFHLSSITGAKSHMPRKTNYGFDKRRKEQDRKAKKDAKMLDRQRRREQEPVPPSATSQADGADAARPLPLPPNEEL